MPVLFFAVINQGVFGALQTINSFPSERLLSLRERASGMYYASAYFLAKSTAEMIVQGIVPWVFSVTIYFMVRRGHLTSLRSEESPTPLLCRHRLSST